MTVALVRPDPLAATTVLVCLAAPASGFIGVHKAVADSVRPPRPAGRLVQARMVQRPAVMFFSAGAGPHPGDSWGGGFFYVLISTSIPYDRSRAPPAAPRLAEPSTTSGGGPRLPLFPGRASAYPSQATSDDHQFGRPPVRARRSQDPSALSFLLTTLRVESTAGLPERPRRRALPGSAHRGGMP